MNKLILTLILLTTSFQVVVGQPTPFIQNWSDKYQHTTSPLFSSEARQMAFDINTGNIFVMADITSDLDINGNVTGTTYSYVNILKYDPSGNIIGNALIDIGAHSINGFDQKSGFGLHVDASGNVFAGYVSYNASTGFDVNVRKYNSSLSVIWTNTFNGTTTDEGIQMKVTPTGIAYVLVKSYTGTNPARYRLIKANAQGVSAGVFYSFVLNVDFPSSIELDNANNIFATGYKLFIPGAAKSILITAIRPTGVVKWTAADNCGTTTGDDIGNKITFGADGNIYLTGSSVGVTSHGVDVVTMKFSPDGRKAWENFINITLNDGGLFVNVPDVNTVNIGWKGGNTIYVEEMSANTGMSWRRIAYAPTPSSSYTSISGITFSDMQVSNGRSVYVTGTITAASGAQNFEATYLAKLTFQSRGAAVIEMEDPRLGSFASSKRAVKIALDNINEKIYWACNLTENFTNHQNEKIEISSLDGIRIFRYGQNPGKVTTNQIQFSPNPTIGNLQIVADEPIQEFSIFNISGIKLTDKIYTSYDSETDLNIDISNLSPGIYFISVKTESGNKIYEKIIKN